MHRRRSDAWVGRCSIDATELDVFVVDDELHIGELLQELLSEEGYRVAWAPNPHEGLQQIIEHHPRVVLSDVMLPGMNGLELVARVIKIGSESSPRCILMSAAPPPQNVPRDVPFVRKPFDLDTVLDVIKSELEEAGSSRSIRLRHEYRDHAAD